jgi:hypothetical protein
MKTLVPQILEEVEKAQSKESKIKVLRSYEHPVLRGVLQINFNPDVKVNLPEGEPPFKKDTNTPMGYSETNLYAEFRRFYIWLDEKVNLTKIKREQLFIQFLEGIHWTEAEVICLAKDKKLQTKYKSLKEDLVREAFPTLLPPKKLKEAVKTKKPTPSLNES